jgi:hypothetical protein
VPAIRIVRGLSRNLAGMVTFSVRSSVIGAADATTDHRTGGDPGCVMVSAARCDEVWALYLAWPALSKVVSEASGPRPMRPQVGSLKCQA